MPDVVVFGSFISPRNGKTYFNVYLGVASADLASFLYAKLGIELDIYITRTTISFDSYKYVTGMLGTTYICDYGDRSICAALEDDVCVLNNAYAVTQLWRNHTVSLPSDTQYTLPKIRDGVASVVFFNAKLQRAIAVDYLSATFKKVFERTRVMPQHDWAFVGTYPYTHAFCTDQHTFASVEDVHAYLSTKSWSLEFFPPRHGQCIDDMVKLVNHVRPTFCDVTWKAGGATRMTTLDVASELQSRTGVDVVVHVAAAHMCRDDIHSFLMRCRDRGIRRILALRGDGEGNSDFATARDLVAYIRQHFGNHFCIGVAGYPEGHPEYPCSMDENIKYLKSKVDAGAEFIITQMFFDVSIFLTFYTACRKAGIKCPIIPGIMPITTYQGFVRMQELCKVHVPDVIQQFMDGHKTDSQTIRSFGTQVCMYMCKQLHDHGIQHVHIYTMNSYETIHSIV